MLSKYILDAGNCVLLIIDIQQGRLLDKMPRKELLLQNCVSLIKTSEELEIPMLVTEQYPEALGATIGEIANLLAPDTPILKKMSFDACNKDFMNFLKENGRKQILVTGIETHICVFQTARGLMQRGYQVHIVSDAVDSRSPENRKKALEVLRDMGAVITSTEMVIFDLLKIAGTRAFKTILPYIK